MIDPAGDSGTGLSVEQLAEEYLERIRLGDRPTIAEYQKSYPEWEQEIGRVFRSLAMLEDLAGHQDELDHTPIPSSAPSQLADYRILRELGRGGMGVVYEAEHAALRRRVALKVLNAGIATAGHNLERFLREARAAGRLHHTNIVPVFDVGTDGNTHFYAMQCIRGQNLDLVIADLRRMHNEPDDLQAVPPAASASAAQCLLSGVYERPDQPDDALGPGESTDDTVITAKLSQDSSSGIVVPDASELSNVGDEKDGYFRRIARIGLQVADALQYAHDQGVLHRDIKPSNLILDTAGTVWVADFGLARTEGDDLTRSGDIVGTLRYMAPERMQGNADERSDLYGLGLTLYELCTLRPAFGRTDRDDLIRQLTRDAPEPPSTTNTSIPRDLETIVLKAIERDPKDRYQSAEALCDDLRLFLADRPIQARRASFAEQAWRWARRNPVVASLVSCVAVLLAVVASGALIFAFETQRHASELQEETERALQAESQITQAHLEARRSLYTSYLGEANASRWSQRVGRRYRTLDTVRKAAALLPELGFETDRVRSETLTLRNLSIAAMPLVDLRVHREWSVDEKGNHFALSADGRLGACGDADGTITVFNVEDDSVVASLSGPGARPVKMGFSPDGTHFATRTLESSSERPPFVQVWNISTGEAVVSVDTDARSGDFDFSPTDPHIAVLTGGRQAVVYSLDDGEQVATVDVGVTTIHVRYSPDGQRLAVGLGPVEIHSLASDAPIRIKPSFGVGSLCWCRQDRLAIGEAHDDRGRIEIFDINQPDEPAMKFAAHKRNVMLLDSSSDGRILKSVSWDGTQGFWDAYTGERLLKVDEYGKPFGGFRADDCRMPFHVNGNRVGVWDLATGAPYQTTTTPGTSFYRSLEVHPTEPQLVVVATNAGRKLEFWDVNESRRLHVIDDVPRFEVAFAPDGRSIVGTGVGSEKVLRWPVHVHNQPDNSLQIDVGEPEEIAAPARPDRTAQRVTFDRSGRRMALTLTHDTVRVMDLAGEGDHIDLGPHSGLSHATISPDGRWVVTTTWRGQGVRLWDVESGEVVDDLLPESSETRTRFSPDGRWLAAVTRAGQFLWDTDSWTRRLIPPAKQSGQPGPVEFSPDSRLVLTRDSPAVPRLIDVESLEIVAVLESPSAGHDVTLCRFTPDGRNLVVGLTGGFGVWDLKSLRAELSELRLDWSP